MSSFYFGGLEGGATHSKFVLCDDKGKMLAEVSGPSTNHWMLGIPECARRIADMVNKGKMAANILLTTRLKSLGLSLSGCEQESSNRTLENELRANHPNISDNYVVCSDTMGSVFTASPIGGLVLIAGTGSNALLSNPNGMTHNCGGWGNMLGDEGSAWFIAHKALKIVFDDMDNLETSPYPIELVWKLIKTHFNVGNRADLLDHCYSNFQKPFFAQLCKKLAAGANDGDQLCLKIFEDAGRYLAKMTLALLPKVDFELIKSGDLSIVCVGSVWNSWNLLKNGFITEMDRSYLHFGLKLLKLTKPMALGAVYLGVDAIKLDMPRNYTENYEIFHFYRQKEQKNESKLISGTIEVTNF